MIVYRELVFMAKLVCVWVCVCLGLGRGRPQGFLIVFDHTVLINFSISSTLDSISDAVHC